MALFNFQDKIIVLMIKVADLGGAERQALGLADYLIKKCNCKVFMVATHCNKPSKEFYKFAESSGVNKVYYFGVPSITIRKEISYLNIKKTIRAIKYIAHIKKEISKFNPDFIIPFLNTPSKIACLIYKGTGAKLTFWHQLGLDNYNYDVLEKKAIKQAPFFIANASNGLEVFEKDYKIQKDKMFVLPQYVSIKKTEMNKEEIKQEFKIDKKDVVIGMIAHYRDEKYHELLLRAFSKITKTKNVHLVLLGNKTNNEETLNKFNSLQKIIEDQNIINKVSLLSGQPVEKILNILDVGVLVSEIEGTPNVVMEYMLYGIPIIATNHSGCEKLLGSSPFLIQNEEAILIDKIVTLVNNTDLRIKEGNINKERIDAYTIEGYMEKLEEIINIIH
ncbi:MAG: glycosyltransferase [Algibacter sp.]